MIVCFLDWIIFRGERIDDVRVRDRGFHDDDVCDDDLYDGDDDGDDDLYDGCLHGYGVYAHHGRDVRVHDDCGHVFCDDGGEHDGDDDDCHDHNT